ncbi:MAG: ABC transporter ATP-binding protein [Tissierellia bacterium]|nr:ABC transporter ATP-binding protein [Tissierellia bacterium]
MTDIVEFKNITKTFPGIVANDDISFSIKRGEIFSVLGENGAGKSVLMSMLFGMYEPDSGEIYIKGEKMDTYSPRHSTSLNIGMVHQHFKLVENYSIAQNIVLGDEPIKKKFGFLNELNLKKAEEEIEELSKKYGLEVDPRAKIQDINIATRQRVEILKMLYREAEIMIFDEPTAILTPQEIEYLLGIILELKKSGKTIILITHKLEEIKRVADRFAVLNRGKLVAVKDVKSTSTSEMARLMVGRDIELSSLPEEVEKGELILEVKNLEVSDRFGVKKVKDISFKIHGGEVFAVAGVSGNGQNELADSIAGLVDVDSGQIILGGKDITKESIREKKESGIAYIPEDRQGMGLVLDFDIADNMILKSYYMKPFSNGAFLNRSEIDSHAEKLSKEYDIRSSRGIKSIMRSLSGGNQQKAIIAREIEHGSELLIFVQPTRGLDIGAIENTWEQINREKREGKAILLISYELEEVMSLADTIGVIYNGELLTVEDRRNLDRNEIGEYMMGVKRDE